jgi:anion-transporting  ArsA/GET3 family ATPase
VPEKELEKAQDFIQLLEKNNITYLKDRSILKTIQAYDYTVQKQVSISDKLIGLVIPAKQPSAPLIQALLDPTIALEDSLTYDITAWNLFQLNGIKAYGVNENVFSEVKDHEGEMLLNLDTTPHVAYIATPKVPSVTQKIIHSAIQVGASVTFSDVQNGAMIISFANVQNEDRIRFLSNMEKLKIGFNTLDSYRSKTSYDLGSTHYKPIFIPKIAVVVDPANDVNQQGELAYFLTQKYGLKPSFIPSTQLFKSNLFHYTHIIYPDGKHSALSNTNSILLTDWVKKGGKLILMEGARKILEDKDLVAKEDSAKHTSTYALRERAELSNTTSGNMLQVEVEKTHPLAFRIDDSSIYILNQVSDFVKLPKDFTPVLKTSSKPNIVGFVGANKKAQLANSLLLGVKEVEKGKIIWFGFNPLFRAIPNQGQTIFENCFLYTEY